MLPTRWNVAYKVERDKCRMLSDANFLNHVISLGEFH